MKQWNKLYLGKFSNRHPFPFSRNVSILHKKLKLLKNTRTIRRGQTLDCKFYIFNNNINNNKIKNKNKDISYDI